MWQRGHFLFVITLESLLNEYDILPNQVLVMFSRVVLFSRPYVLLLEQVGSVWFGVRFPFAP